MNDGKPHAKLPFSARREALSFINVVNAKRRKAHSARKILIINIVHCVRMCRRFHNNKNNVFYLIPPLAGRFVVEIRSLLQLTRTIQLIKHYKCSWQDGRPRICPPIFGPIAQRPKGVVDFAAGADLSVL